MNNTFDELDGMVRKRSVPVLMFNRLVILSLVILFPISATGMDYSSWAHDAVGYFKAERYARTRGKPMLVYFHTDWCQKCARLDANFLDNPKARRLLEKFSRVEINPEHGPKEHAIFQEYNTQAVPGLYVVFPSFNAKSKRIHPLTVNGDWPINRFTWEIRDFAAQTYRDAGVELLGQDNYRGATKLLEQSLKFDAKNAETYYELGRSYEAMGDPYLQRAQKYFAKAAKLDNRFDGAD